MELKTDGIREFLKKRVNLLIVDDDETVLGAVSDLFCSELFNVLKASTVDQAVALIDSASYPWHCWILDIALEQEEDGLMLLDKNKQFPFIIMLSGLCSMTTAARAIQKGALKVFDKNPGSLDLLLEEVCKIAALGFILEGKKTQYLNVYSLLKDQRITSIQDWAHKACMTERQLERICSMHSDLTPRYIIPLFYTLFHFLRTDSSTDQYDAHHEHDDFYMNHISFFAKQLDKYQQTLLFS